MEERCHKDSIRIAVLDILPGAQKYCKNPTWCWPFLMLLLIFAPASLFSQVLNLGHAAKIENGFGSSSPLMKQPYDVFVKANLAYVTSFSGNALVIVDLTLPAIPTEIGTLIDGQGGALLNQPQSIFVSGNYAYVTTLSVGGSLEIIDVSNPLAPVHTGGLSNGQGGALLGNASGVYVSGNYAYVANSGIGTNGALEIIDVSNPAKPKHVSALIDGGGSAPYLNTAFSVFVSGNFAYVGSWGSGALEIVDISNPLLPVHKGSLLDGGGATPPFIKNPYSIYVSGNFAYVADNYWGALEIVDVSNPAAPVHKGSLSDGGGVAPYLASPYSVKVSGNYAYVVDNFYNALEIVDVTNPAAPVHKSSLTNGTGGAQLNGPYSVFISGSHAYVASYRSNALEVVDVSDPAAPVHSNSLVDGGGGALIGVSRSVFIFHNYAYIASEDIGSLEIVDVSNPAAPVHKGSLIDGGGISPYLAQARSVYVVGHYAYVVGLGPASNNGSLEIIDISNAVAPIHVGSLSLAFGANAVEVHGSYAYIAGNGKFAIVNVTNPAAPALTATLASGAGVPPYLAQSRSMKVSGNYAYVVGSNALEVIDVTTPATPVHFGSLVNGAGVAPFIHSTRSVFISGNNAYITSVSLNTLEIVDISNPALPVHKGSIADGQGGALMQSPETVAVAGNYAFVALAGSYAVEVVDVSNPAAPVHFTSIRDGTGGALLKAPDGLAVNAPFAYVTGLGGGLEIIYLYAPGLGSFSPSTGSQGTPVTLTGINYNQSLSVTFNGTPASTPQSVTATSAVVTVPAGATIGPISVKVNGEASIGTVNFMVIPVATKATNTGQTNFTANWSDVGAKGYFLDLSTDNFSTFVSGYNNLSLGNVTSVNITGLSPATTYQYRLRSSDGSVNSDYSNTISMLTIPGTPVAVNATLIGQTSFTANWTSVAGATGYYLDVALDNVFTKFLVGYTNLNISGASNTTQFVTGLSAYTSYYYRVRSFDDNGSSGSSNVIMASTLDIVPPVVSNSSTPNAVTISAGVTPVLNATIFDNVSVDSAKIFYRGISQGKFNSVALQGPGGIGGNYSVTVQTNWYDSLGLEYYFMAKDEAGNKTVTASYYMQLITPSISLPALPSGTNQSDYRIVAFPYQLLPDNKITTVYQGVPWNDNTKATISWWNPALKNSAGGYDQYSSGALTNIEPGKGYWVLVTTPTTPQLANINAPKYNRANLFSMTLKPKWNEIGNPYPAAISWDDVIALNQEINPGALFSPLTVYNGKGYTSGKQLKAFEGGFVKNLGTSDITIQIPFSGQSTIGGRLAAIGSDISQEAWNIFLHIDQNGFTNQLGGFGMHPLARSGPDRFDNFNPPRFLQTPEVNSVNAEFPGLAFSNNMVESQQDYTWQFTPAGSTGMPAQLSWSPDVITNSKQLILLDEEQIKVIDMGSVSHYEFTLTSRSSFRIFYGSNIQDKVTTQSIAASAPYPNPLTRDAVAKINLALPDSNDQYQVSMQLYTGQGDLVETLDESLPSGLHHLEFTLSGQPLAPGIYIYRLAVASDKTSSVYSGKIIKP